MRVIIHHGDEGQEVMADSNGRGMLCPNSFNESHSFLRSGALLRGGQKEKREAMCKLLHALAAPDARFAEHVVLRVRLATGSKLFIE